MFRRISDFGNYNGGLANQSVFTLILGATGFLAMSEAAERTQGGDCFHLGSSVVLW